MSSAVSRYRFLERPDGFRVEAPQRVPVSVTLRETGFHVHVHEPRQLTLFADLDADGTPIARVVPTPHTNLVQYRKLADLVSAGVTSSWKPRQGRAPANLLKAWALTQTRRALGGRIHEQWRRLTAKADPVVWSVQKAVFATALTDVNLLHAAGLYRDRYLTQDIQRYRAAASLVTIAEDQASLDALRLAGEVPTEAELEDIRRRRNVGWDLVLQVWQHNLSATDAAVMEFVEKFAACGDLKGAFRASIESADAIADRLRREAGRVAQKAKLTADLQQLDLRFQTACNGREGATRTLSLARNLCRFGGL